MLVKAGSLSIESLQDSETFRSKQLNVGLSLSLDFNNPTAPGGKTTFGGVGASGSFSQTKVRENFTSVAEQSGITAGAGGFDITVTGATDLKGGIIASTADASLNTLRTAKLTSSDLVNSEKFKASSIGFSLAVKGIGADKPAAPADKPAATGDKPAGDTGTAGGSTSGTGTSGTGTSGTGTSGTGGGTTTTDGKGNVDVAKRGGTPAAGFAIPGLGTVSAGLPTFLSASGNQSGTTQSAIAPATIVITPGASGVADAASQQVADTISRDTATANDGALIQKFDAEKRAEVQEAFETVKQLATQVSVFFANRAAEEKQAKDEAAAKAKALAAGFRIDENGNKVPLTDAERALYSGDEKTKGSIAFLKAKEESLHNTYKDGGTFKIVTTALTAAAGGNVAGGIGNLARATAANVLQSLATTEVKKLVDGFSGDDATREVLRTALQSVVGCGGATLGGSKSCGSAAVGAAAAVVVGNLLKSLEPRKLDAVVEIDANGNIVRDRSLEEQQAYSNLVATIAGGIAAGAGLDASVAASSAVIETENNTAYIITSFGQNVRICTKAGDPECKDATPFDKFRTGTAGERKIYAEFAAKYPEASESTIVAALAAYYTSVIAHFQNKEVAELSKNEAIEKIRNEEAQALDILSGGSFTRKQELSDQLGNNKLTHQQLVDAANFKSRFDELSDSAKAAVIADLKSQSKGSATDKIFGDAVTAIFGKDDDPVGTYLALTQAGADLKDFKNGFANRLGELATPAAKLARDLLIVGTAYGEDGLPNPAYETPEGRAQLAAARAALQARFDAVGNAVSETGKVLAQLASDLESPPWVGPDGYPTRVPSREEVAAYNARVAHGVATLQRGAAAVAGASESVVLAIAQGLDNCGFSSAKHTAGACGGTAADVSTLGLGAGAERLVAGAVSKLPIVSKLDVPDAPNKPELSGTGTDPANPTPGKANSPDTDSEAGAGDGAPLPPRPDKFTPDPSFKEIPASAQNHIIEGEIKANGKVQGAHYAQSKNIVIDRNTAVYDSSGNGVFSAEVRVKDTSGVPLPKQANQGRSTFFPETWNSQRVLSEVESAFKDGPRQDSPVSPPYYLSRSGVKLTIHTDAAGKVATAFPRFPQ